MKYTAIIESNTSYPMEIETDSRNVLLIANEYGRAESGESVTVKSKAGKTLSRAVWDVSSRKYIRVSV